MSRQIFVSYSHRDQPIVTPLAHLLRATHDWVFLDTDTLKAGSKWREQIDEAIARASLFVIFWCRHSNESPEVGRECTRALDCRKDILPVLLDSTPLPPRLSEYQWIDFRELAEQKHQVLIWASAPDSSSTRVRKVATPLLVTLIFAVLAGMATLFLARSSSDALTPQPFPFAIAVLFVAAALWLLLRRRRTQQTVASGPLPYELNSADAHLMSLTLRDEVRRRLEQMT